MRLLIVEDNVDFSGLVAASLTRAGFETDQVNTAAAARKAVTSIDYVAVLLDLGLPDDEGIDLLRDLKASVHAPPIIVTTARDSLDDRVGGLQSGADDYLVKPFAMDELVARLHALLRRAEAPAEEVLHLGNVALDLVNHRVKVGDDTQPLPAREVEVLEFLMRHQGHVVKREALAAYVFGKHGHQGAGALDVYLSRLRRIFSEARATVRIDNIHGLGFLLSDGGETAVSSATAGRSQHP
ncbi:MAG: response regulator transcription factor [Reyranella sp.]|jgi:DNA-binding response OmpR family regulator|uniref:response regulator transcription factor n=1 Tax=Reyranella sp. TaxID=1929291 RepID=UPI0025FBA0D2|nr:response regulator transcription factor [Reyranella sp.]MBR2816451.1 response regulator transcription factor [Reyranella sp.]